MTLSMTALSKMSTSHSRIVTKSDPMFAVTLFHMHSAPLFRLTARAASKLSAIANAERVYASLLSARDLIPVAGNDEEYLISDPALTQVQRSREAEGWKLQYFVRFAGDVAEPATCERLSGSHVRAMLKEVVGADPGLLTALVSGETIEPCPIQDWSRRVGWLTIDCAFRITDDTGRYRDLRPLSSAMREAVRFIVLEALSAGGETLQMALPHRQAAGRCNLQSATLRAFRKSQGPQLPTRLIDWLGARGLNELADAVRASVVASQQ